MLERNLPPRMEAASEAELMELERRYCSHGDTVHYLKPPKLFERCEGSFLYDSAGRPYLDLQMWYSAVNFGYGNARLNGALKRQLERLPQLASQYLHREKIELAAWIARRAEAAWGEKGRVHFNVGGSQAIEDALKLVRNARRGKGLMFAFEGGYHGRTLGASAITSSYRYRRRFGHFDRAHFIPFPYHFRAPRGMSKEECGAHCVAQFARLFESEYQGVWDAQAGEAEFAAFFVEPIQGTGGYLIPPKNFFIELKKVLDRHGILLVVDEIQMGFYRTGKLWAIEHFGVTPDVLVFGNSPTASTRSPACGRGRNSSAPKCSRPARPIPPSPPIRSARRWRWKPSRCWRRRTSPPAYRPRAPICSPASTNSNAATGSSATWMGLALRCASKSAPRTATPRTAP